MPIVRSTKKSTVNLALECTLKNVLLLSAETHTTEIQLKAQKCTRIWYTLNGIFILGITVVDLQDISCSSYLACPCRACLATTQSTQGSWFLASTKQLFFYRSLPTVDQMGARMEFCICLTKQPRIVTYLVTFGYISHATFFPPTCLACKVLIDK